MTPISKLATMLIAGVMAGCRPSARSAADTTAATTATIPAITAGPSDSVSAATPPGQSGNTPAAGGSRTMTGNGTPTSSSATSSNRNGNSGILGRDSVIRFPRRGLPTASSTRIRE